MLNSGTEADHVRCRISGLRALANVVSSSCTSWSKDRACSANAIMAMVVLVIRQTQGKHSPNANWLVLSRSEVTKLMLIHLGTMPALGALTALNLITLRGTIAWLVWAMSLLKLIMCHA